jgi:hypothetical protein
MWNYELVIDCGCDLVNWKFSTLEVRHGHIAIGVLGDNNDFVWDYSICKLDLE